MKVQHSRLTDFNEWLVLAREVEHLFGPMADDASFQEALQQAISDKVAFCICSETSEKDQMINGGIIISKESNEIAWLAVLNENQGKGFGSALLKFAISQLNPYESIFVQTFDESVPEGISARALYEKFGFIDHKKATPNPAGVPTVIMKLPISGQIG